MKKTTALPRAPRNPFAVLAGRRAAGSHRPGSGAVRQAQRRDLHQQLRHPQDGRSP